MPIIIETLEEFDARHTTDGPKLGDPNTSRELFPDGAMRTRKGEQFEPPTEPAELLKAKRKYVALKLRLEEDAFKAFKGDCEEKLANKMKYANLLPGPPTDAKQQLERGAERIGKIREELAVIDRDISQLPDEVARRSYLEQKQRDQSKTRDQLNEIAGVVI